MRGATEPGLEGSGRDNAGQGSPGGADREAPYKPRYTPLWNNFITMAGVFLAAMALVLLLTFGMFSLVTPTANPYVDIVGYLVVPGILVLGVITIPFGILFKSWRLHRHNPELRLAFRFPHVDLNDPAQRRVAKIVVIGGLILFPVVGLSSYHGYHYTDSADFCSKACHAAMHPQATTYEHSAHARVSCAECHIGSGASWFVKSKLSGTRQVLAMWQDSFPRPIPSAITDLRPARDTCEECHWPKKFFGAQLREIVRFASDERNTRRDIDMLVKTGGGDETTGRATGIHRHMALEGTVEYIPTDDKLQDIPWVSMTDPAGNKLIYRSDGRPSSDPEPEGQKRELDCMDCHNRPAHKFRSPQDAVDIYLAIGRKMDPRLPFIKREAVAALAQPYPDKKTGREQIGFLLTRFYQENYGDQWETLKPMIHQAIDAVREIYDMNFFPSMNVDWRSYPDNIGHLVSPGCFRCHEGTHVNQHGEKLSHECNICHDFLNPLEENGRPSVLQQGEFIHPLKLAGAHAELRCDKCHTGGPTPLSTCAGCHVEQTAFRAGTTAAFEPFGIEADAMAESVDCEACHDLSLPTEVETIDAACMDCHEDEEDRFEGMLASWKKEVHQMLLQAEEGADSSLREVLDTLRRAGPLHNIEAARLILRSLGSEPGEPGEP